MMPAAIQALGRTDVTITWEDDRVTTLSARRLRGLCGCAYCVDEMTGRALLDPGTIPEDLRVEHVELVGQYAMAVRFSDGHATGIYRFDKLHVLAESIRSGA